MSFALKAEGEMCHFYRLLQDWQECVSDCKRWRQCLPGPARPFPTLCCAFASIPYEGPDSAAAPVVADILHCSGRWIRLFWQALLRLSIAAVKVRANETGRYLFVAFGFTPVLFIGHKAPRYRRSLLFTPSFSW